MIVEFKTRYEMDGTFSIGQEVYLDFNNSKCLKGGVKVAKINRKKGKVTYDIAIPFGYGEEFTILKNIDSALVCADPKDLI
jgi:hypothetical protein